MGKKNPGLFSAWMFIPVCTFIRDFRVCTNGIGKSWPCTEPQAYLPTPDYKVQTNQVQPMLTSPCVWDPESEHQYLKRPTFRTPSLHSVILFEISISNRVSQSRMTIFYNAFLVLGKDLDYLCFLKIFYVVLLYDF